MKAAIERDRKQASKVVRSSHFRADIQGLRALAVLAVLLFHAGVPLKGGYLGVDAFFVISGFVIGSSLLNEFRATGKLNLYRFYSRRIFRLAPNLGITVFVTLLFSVFLLPPLGAQLVAAQTGLGAVTLMANYVIAKTTGGYFDKPAESNPLLNMWSLAVEEQFYLVLPAALFGCFLLLRWKKSLAPMLVFGGILVAFASWCLSFFGAQQSIDFLNPLFHEIGLIFNRVHSILSSAFSLPALDTSTDWLFGFYSPLTRLWEFLVGFLILFIKVPFRGRWADLAYGLSFVTLVISFSLLPAPASDLNPFTIIPVLCTALLILLGATNESIIRNTLSGNVARYIGDRSYSLYLWHWPFIVLAIALFPENPFMALIGASLSIPISFLAFRFIETPWRVRSRTKLALVSCIALFALIPVSQSIFIMQNSRTGWGRVELQRAVIGHEASGCEGHGSVFVQCEKNPTASGKQNYLVGDSNATMLSEAVIGGALATNQRITIRSYPGCAYLTIATNGSGNCRDWYVSTQQLLSTAPKGRVLLSFTSRQWALPSVWGRLVSEEEFENNMNVLSNSLQATIDELKISGHEVAIILPIPRFENNQKSLAVADWSLLQMMNRSVAVSYSLEDLEPRQLRVKNTISSIAQKNGVALVDLSERICPQNTCTPFVGDIAVYSDAGHITSDMSRLLSGEFTTLFSK